MLGPQAQPEVDLGGAHRVDFILQKGRASAISRGARLSSGEREPGGYFDLITVHSTVLPVSMKPLPLQAFWPLQAFAALLQALWPLQAFAPAQTMADADVAKVATANAAAAVAIMVRLVMDILPVFEPPDLCRGGGKSMDRRMESHNK